MSEAILPCLRGYFWDLSIDEVFRNMLNIIGHLSNIFHFLFDYSFIFIFERFSPEEGAYLLQNLLFGLAKEVFKLSEYRINLIIAIGVDIDFGSKVFLLVLVSLCFTRFDVLKFFHLITVCNALICHISQPLRMISLGMVSFIIFGNRVTFNEVLQILINNFWFRLRPWHFYLPLLLIIN